MLRDTSSFTYTAKRPFTSVSVRLEEDVVHWEYRANGARWSRTVLLSELLPRPTISQQESQRLHYFVAGVVAILVGMFFASVLPEVQSKWGFSGLAAFGLLGAVYAWFHEPIEWASWRWFLGEGEFYIFAGADRTEFELAIAKIDEAIMLNPGPFACGSPTPTD